MKTEKEIQGEVVRLLRSSVVADEITGGIYRSGYRPRDSTSEDVVVIFTSGSPGQIQRGVVTIHLYVPDVYPYENGVPAEDGCRTERLEMLMQEWAEGLSRTDTPYKFMLNDAVRTDDEPELHQHFIVVRLNYQFINT